MEKKKSKTQRSRRTGKRMSNERNNYQDRFSDREFDKGFDAAESKSKFPMKKAGHKSNDPQWYFKDANILRDVASFSANRPLGTNLNMRYAWDEAKLNGFITQYGCSSPGLMTMELALSPGVSTDAQSPLNLAATNVYSFVRYKNSGGTNYDSPDLMLYLIAMDSIYACWNWMKRIYGMASTYSQTNRYMPQAYMKANYVDFNDVIENLADFRAYLNVKANEISAFCVPSTMNYNVRHSWLFANIYEDSDTRKAQQYMYVPAYFYQYDEQSSPQGGILTTVPVAWKKDPNTATLFKVADLKSMLNTMLQSLNYSEDIGIMSGDILKAYGDSGLFKIGTFDADYKVEPVYNREVLSQFENGRIITFAQTDISTMTITQDPDTNFLKYQPQSSTTRTYAPNEYMNFHWDSPSPEDVMVASRLMFTTKAVDETDPTQGYIITSCGSEFCTGSWMFWNTQSANFMDEVVPYVNPTVISAIETHPQSSLVPNESDSTATAKYLGRMVLISQFDWHPAIQVATRVPTGTNACDIGYLWDFDNYITVSIANIEAMNLVALLSLFNVPN